MCLHYLNSYTITSIRNCSKLKKPRIYSPLTVIKTTPQHPDARRVQRILNKMARTIVHGFDTRVRLFSMCVCKDDGSLYLAEGDKVPNRFVYSNHASWYSSRAYEYYYVLCAQVYRDAYVYAF